MAGQWLDLHMRAAALHALRRAWSLATGPDQARACSGPRLTAAELECTPAAAGSRHHPGHQHGLAKPSTDPPRDDDCQPEQGEEAARLYVTYMATKEERCGRGRARRRTRPCPNAAKSVKTQTGMTARAAIPFGDGTAPPSRGAKSFQNPIQAIGLFETDPWSQQIKSDRPTATVLATTAATTNRRPPVPRPRHPTRSRIIAPPTVASHVCSAWIAQSTGKGGQVYTTPTRRREAQQEREPDRGRPDHPSPAAQDQPHRDAHAERGDEHLPLSQVLGDLERLVERRRREQDDEPRRWRDERDPRREEGPGEIRPTLHTDDGPQDEPEGDHPDLDQDGDAVADDEIERRGPDRAIQVEDARRRRRLGGALRASPSPLPQPRLHDHPQEAQAVAQRWCPSWTSPRRAAGSSPARRRRAGRLAPPRAGARGCGTGPR